MADTPAGPTLPPDRKVWAGGLVGIVTWAIMFAAAKAGHPIDLGLQALIPVVLGYIVSYVVPPSVRDIVKRVDNTIVRIANADQSNPTTAVIVDHATSKAAADADISMGLIVPPK